MPTNVVVVFPERDGGIDFTDDPERLKRYAGIIYKENKRLENQVERVLNVAKLDKQKLLFQAVKKRSTRRCIAVPRS